MLGCFYLLWRAETSNKECNYNVQRRHGNRQKEQSRGEEAAEEEGLRGALYRETFKDQPEVVQSDVSTRCLIHSQMSLIYHRLVIIVRHPRAGLFWTEEGRCYVIT
ncbi:hypothetical protein PBY51_000431 [Eleginops maclovinus]|uniref:Uncharacterized protein n=1 Tax=Eleginops maclovinus TaxID=56733 RepID=A0AAN7XFK4_ELEMC|nr:hypothetical protein PBY51_000431 [Eleginops maclovinus]